MKSSTRRNLLICLISFGIVGAVGAWMMRDVGAASKLREADLTAVPGRTRGEVCADWNSLGIRWGLDPENGRDVLGYVKGSPGLGSREDIVIHLVINERDEVERVSHKSSIVSW